MAELEAIAARLRAADPGFDASVRLLFAREPWEVAPDAAIVRALQAASEPVLGRTPRLVGDTPWMDAALLAAAGVETVVMGPTGEGEHSIEEWVDLDSVVQMAEILARTAIAYCS
jgi:acetylornithine deacetylase